MNQEAWEEISKAASADYEIRIAEAFREAMAGRHYGYNETHDAFAWFKHGWMARGSA